MFSFEDNSERYAYNYPLMYNWLMLKAQGKSLESFFFSYGIKEISIYGVGEIGELFYNDIKTLKKLNVICFVDKKADAYPNGYYGIPVMTPEEFAAANSTEMLVITPVFYMNQITTELTARGVSAQRILSLNQVIYGGA